MSQVALADEAGVAAPRTSATYDLGVRVGGYGFRRDGAGGDEAWTECRMNGLGVFGSRVLTGPLYLEAGLDAYTSDPEAALPTDLPISRMSSVATVAAGARASFTSRLRGFVQLGGGAELTRVSVPYRESLTIRDTKLMPAGFLGFGLDVRLGKQTYVGANVRTLMMGNFNYTRDQLEMSEQWDGAPSSDRVFDASLDFAAQGQLYVRRDL
ncbi:MAG TPA: hypothetical protein VFQ53_24965 [Kofleriaceae bacterium]|nr:hypothetical protein [Kofleriaceae bacterium]